MNEKDLRPEKTDHKLYLVVYAVKNLKTSLSDGSLPISRLYAGGGESPKDFKTPVSSVCLCLSFKVYDLGTTLGSLINLSPDKRNISPSMNLL